VLDRANTQPSGSAPSATGHRFGTLELQELLAARGEAGLWLAADDRGRRTLLRLYPGLPKLEEWHALELAASQLAYAADARLVPIKEIALDVWPRLSFACPDAEPLARRIARGPMTPQAAVAMCADVAGALDALRCAGVPPVDISPADVVLVGERARLLADVGLPGGTLAHACIDLGHVAPERAAAIADRMRGIRAARPPGVAPTAESMTYGLASIVSAAVHAAEPGGAGPEGALPAALEQVLRRGLAEIPSERYATPAALVEALGNAIGIDPWQSGGSATRARRADGARSPGRRATVRRPTAVRRPAAPRPAPANGRRAGLALSAAAVVAAAAIGALAGSATTAPHTQAAVRLAGAGVSVEAPRGWVRGEPTDSPAALGDPALVARPPGRSNATALVVARAAAPLLAQLADAAPQPVRLGENDAWRYRDVALGDRGVGDVYLLEDGEGSIVAGCLGAAAVRARCSAALTTLSIGGGRSAPLGGDAARRGALADVVGELDRARTSRRRALATATTGRRQAAEADRLSAAYARASERAASVGTVGGPGDLPRLVDRLERLGRDYAALATAARATRRAGYAQARERIAADERALEQDLAALAPAASGS